MVTLNFKKREILGKKVKNLRKQGLIPAEIYGHNFSNQHIEIKKNDILKILKSNEKTAIINLVNETTKEKMPVIIQNIAYHPITQEIIHIDFHHIIQTEKIKTKVPIELIGEAPATKKGLIIIKSLEEIEIEALPKDLPNKIEIDISHLENLKQTIHIKDLKLDKKIKILTDPETILVYVNEPTSTSQAEEETPSQTSQTQTTPSETPKTD